MHSINAHLNTYCGRAKLRIEPSQLQLTCCAHFVDSLTAASLGERGELGTIMVWGKGESHFRSFDQ
jgi:hypothetical protein